MPSQYCSLLKVFPVQSSPADRHVNAQQSSHLLHSNSLQWTEDEVSMWHPQHMGGDEHLWCKTLKGTWKAGFYGAVHSAIYKREQDKRKKLFKSEADTKTPSNAGCLIQSWMLHLALRRKHESPGLAGCNSGTHQGRAMPRDSHLQDLPSTAKITVLFLSGRYKCVRSEPCFKWKLPEGRTLLCLFSEWKSIGNIPPGKQIQMLTVRRLYLYSVSMRGYILEKQPCKKLCGIAERSSEQTECSDISFFEQC